MIYSFEGFVPVVHESAFVHPQAAVTGNVIIGRNVYVGPGAALRADWGAIEVEDGCNIQENCTVHVFPGATVVLEEGAHLGHGSVVHGARICRNVLVGMNAVVMDRAVVGAGSIIGALSLIPADMVIPERKVVAGAPARIIKDVSDEMLAWKTEGTALYQGLPERCHAALSAVEPLRQLPPGRKAQQAVYKTWNETRGGG